MRIKKNMIVVISGALLSVLVLALLVGGHMADKAKQLAAYKARYEQVEKEPDLDKALKGANELAKSVHNHSYGNANELVNLLEAYKDLPDALAIADEQRITEDMLVIEGYKGHDHHLVPNMENIAKARQAKQVFSMIHIIRENISNGDVDIAQQNLAALKAMEITLANLDMKRSEAIIEFHNSLQGLVRPESQQDSTLSPDLIPNVAKKRYSYNDLRNYNPQTSSNEELKDLVETVESHYGKKLVDLSDMDIARCLVEKKGENLSPYTDNVRYRKVVENNLKNFVEDNHKDLYKSAQYVWADKDMYKVTINDVNGVTRYSYYIYTGDPEPDGSVYVMDAINKKKTNKRIELRSYEFNPR